jgi:hypothetical protein
MLHIAKLRPVAWNLHRACSTSRSPTERNEVDMPVCAAVIVSLVDRKGFKVRVFRGEGVEFEIGASGQ